MSESVKARQNTVLPPELRGSIFSTQGVTNAVVLTSIADQTRRGRPGERLDELFEEQCDRLNERGLGHVLAVDAGDFVLTYAQLDSRANQLARFLRTCGARSGDRVALLFDDPVESYVAMLAVLKIHAAYVPLDPGFPADRISYIINDSDAAMVFTGWRLREVVPDVDAPVVWLAEGSLLLETIDSARLSEEEKGTSDDELAYIIYTSGSTGKPKGVAVEHSSICNFVRTASDLYGFELGDRVYQGMTIAFDFSVEEIWVPWMAGATLVPKFRGPSLVGAELAEFLELRRVTALCCVPTLLATIDRDLPELRFLLVSGEACPQNLIVRWHRPGRRFLNVYGPTEATVTATWTIADPDRAVTLGVPLPTYSVVILDPTHAAALPAGVAGEIGLAGVGLARGYVNRSDLTDRAFIPDFIGIGNNPSCRIYRTGDLGLINDNGEVEYLGRIDTQVKIRGYRIELTEIESVVMQVPGIAQALVSTYEPTPGPVELVAYYTLRRDCESLDERMVRARLREQLPAYMVPVYMERLSEIPMLVSDKADRKQLPPPSRPRLVDADHDYVAPKTMTEEVFAAALSEILSVGRVSTTAHFFNDLGANSLSMAQFSGLLRKDPNLPSVSMRSMYLNPTVAELAAAVGRDSVVDVPTEEPDAVHLASNGQFLLCGGLQLLVYLSYIGSASLLAYTGLQWTTSAAGLLEIIERTLLFGVGSFLVLSIVPIMLKWVLVGRWRPTEIPVWSLAYFRFWLAKTLVNISPLRIFVGTPIYPWYLRALGAKIGRRVSIFSPAVPVCTDLLAIGDDTVIRKDSLFTGYRAHRGLIQTGPVTLGKNVLISEHTVLEIDTHMGDGAQLGHSSALHRFQSVPEGQSWHGSPAELTSTDFRTVGPAECGNRRRAIYSLWVVVNRVLLIGPAGISVIALVLPWFLIQGYFRPDQWWFYLEAFIGAFILLVGAILTSLLAVITVPRLLNHFLTPGRTYPLYGFHFAVHRTIVRLTNIKMLMHLTGDSSLIVHYLRLLGYKQPGLVQTGSNFGVELKHESPYLSTVGSGTMVSDGLSIINADYSDTSFRVAPTVIGANSFFGNNIAYPATAKMGDNCLYGTKVMVPLDGSVREGVGILGSPPFEIPRTVLRDTSFDALKTRREFRRRLRKKNRHNAVTLALHLLTRWINLFVALVIGSVALTFLDSQFAVVALMLAMITTFIWSIMFSVAVERASLAFKPLVPRFCSIYDPHFWNHERFWKLCVRTVIQVFNGTPYKPMIWRLLGVRIGKRVLDDGMDMPERSGLVTIGDDCTFNAQSCIQCHSMEDGAFKLEAVTVGDQCTVGVGGFVHYSTNMGNSSSLKADSFLMKGEEIPPNGIFGGNPARDLARHSDQLAAQDRGASQP